MKIKKWIGGLLVGLLVAGCGTESESTLKDDNALDEDANHVVAKHCEVFIDKVTYTKYGMNFLYAFLKVHLDRLDAPIKRIGFMGKKRFETTAPGTGEVTTYESDWSKVVEASSHLGSDHYFWVSFHVSGARYGFQMKGVYQGAFFVETQKGTYYWVNESLQSERNFTINQPMFKLLEEKLRDVSLWDLGGPYRHITKVPQASEIIPELNPQKCR